MDRWYKPYGIRTPIVSSVGFGSTGHGVADLIGVPSLYHASGYTLIAWTRPSTVQYSTGCDIFTFGNKVAGQSSEWDLSGNFSTAGIRIRANTTSYYTSENSGANIEIYTLINSAGLPGGTNGYFTTYPFPLDLRMCIISRVASDATGTRYNTWINGGTYTDIADNKTWYGPQSERFYINKNGKANIVVYAAALVCGPVPSEDATLLARHGPRHYAEVSSFPVYAWVFDEQTKTNSNRYPEITGKSPSGSYDFIFSVSSLAEEFARTEGSVFHPDYYIRLHDVSSDGQTLINSATDIDLTKFSTHVSITRDMANMFNRPSAGIASVLMANVVSGYTPWTQSKLREDAALSISAHYGGSLHVLFNGSVKDIKTERHQAGHLNVVINAFDSVNYMRREAFNEKYRQNTFVSSFLADVLSGGTRRTYSSVTAIGRSVPLVWARDSRTVDEVLNRASTFYNPWQWLGYRVNSQVGSISFINIWRVEPHSYAANGTSVESIEQFYSLSARSDTENIINRLNIRMFPRESTLSQVTSGAGTLLPMQIPASTTRNLWFYHADAERAEWEGAPGECQTLFTNSAHFTFNVASDNSGADASAHLSIVASGYGVKGFYQLSNTSPTTDAWLTMFITQPFVFKSLGEGQVQSVSSTSQVSYGLRELNISDNIWHQIDADTSSFANYMVTRYKAPIPKIEAKLRQYPYCFFNVGALVSVVDTVSNVDGQYIVTGVDHDITMGRGKEHTLVIRGEKHV